MRILYKIVYTLGFILTWPYWLLRDIVHHKPYSFKARFLGPGRMLPKREGRPRVWVWALSLGEVLAAKKLVPALEEAGVEVVISSTTAIGRDAAVRTFPSRLVLASPLDFGLSTRRFLDSVDPDLLVLIETDIWPGILFRMQQRGLPKALISARISPRSLKGYGYIKVFWGRVLRLLDLITTQSDEDRTRLVELGADPAATEVIGDLKFDREVVETTPESRAAILAETGWPDGRWIVAGSTHAGEEAIILDTFTQLKEKARYSDLKLLLAPRNKSDFEAVWELMCNKGLPACHRGAPEASDKDKDIFLLDTLGELDRFYDLAEIALVGKSWAGQHKGGGHNPLEPAAKGKPVLFGPLTHNYRWMTKALTACGGGLMVPDQAALLAALEDLLDNPEKARDMGQRAADFVRTHQGATQRTMDLLRPYIEQAKVRSRR
ncbi:3-deoxy-D-manno-octulosonic acid transferase [Deltaproteobacteria bacterium OttesenSCG-928-M10]|nr:3-deoxy-D-manno-octulosonic acid transferase [Deltaproteobacteria bacterium OttesenSCG-928-M10]